MVETTSAEDRRAQHVAAGGFWFTAVLYGALVILAYKWNSSAVGVVARLVLAGLPIWGVLYLIFKQARRVRAEQLETAELRHARESGDSAALFDMDDESFLIEQNRLRWMVKWFLPGTTVLVSGYLILGNFVAWDWTLAHAFGPAGDGGISRATDPTVLMWFPVVFAFVCHFASRWMLTLSRLPDWRLLHGGATLIAVNALACLGLFIAFMATGNIGWVEPLICYVLRVVLVVLGLELLVNFIMDFYRPRMPGMVSRPAFDSRLLGLLTEPGGIAKSIAEAANYQFGFEVSSTWFYQLLQRWLLPLTVATIIIILSLTSVVVVDADEQVMVERFGKLRTAQPLDAGIHLKWPYPIEIVQRAKTKSIGELVIGEATADDADPHEAVLWTKAHEYVPELMLLVAAPKSDEDDDAEAGMTSQDTEGGKSVPVSLLMVSVPIEYRIKDVKQYLYHYEDPVKVLEGVAYQYLSDYASSVDTDELIGPGRDAFNKRLRDLIQTRLDELEVGIELAFVGVRGAHPPAKDQVAAAFQAAIVAQTNKQTLISAAEGQARKILTAVAGTESQALAFDELLRQRDALQSDAEANATKLTELERRIDQMLVGDPIAGTAPLSGNAAVVIANAGADASRKKADAAVKVQAFATEVVAFQTAPNLYLQRRTLDIYRGLDGVRKYVILGDPDNVIIEYDTQEEGGLDRVLTEKKK